MSPVDMKFTYTHIRLFDCLASTINWPVVIFFSFRVKFYRAVLGITALLVSVCKFTPVRLSSREDD